MLRSSRQEVIWRLFIISNRKPNFLNYWTPGWVVTAFSYVDAEEKPDTTESSNAVISGGLTYVHTKLALIPYASSLNGLPSLPLCFGSGRSITVTVIVSLTKNAKPIGDSVIRYVELDSGVYVTLNIEIVYFELAKLIVWKVSIGNSAKVMGCVNFISI
jgi:hypothetical protein